MNKLILSCLTMLTFAFALQAQESPEKALKKAGSALKTYQLDPGANIDKLHEAFDMINIAAGASETSSNWVTLNSQGEIYNTIANQIVNIRQLNIGDMESLPKADDPALTAYTAYAKALEVAAKKFQTKDALKGIRAVQTNLNNMGIYAYEDGKFEKAFMHFNGVLEAHRLLIDAGMESMLESDDSYQEQMYITGLAALSANKIAEATPIFNELKASGAQKAAIYEALYKIEAADALAADSKLSEEDQVALMEKAYVNLDEGRQQFPDDISLLFAEINHFLRINKLDVLISKLESAIEKEPENISLYSTMGNVYDNLYQRETKAGNTEAAQGHFDNALKYYNQALERKSDFTDAIYSIGALYFNKAATMTQELQSLADDFSKEGQKRYEELQGLVNAEFENALPFFERVERIKPNDVNTLIALKEIFARKSDYDKSNEFKVRLEKAQAGEALESYFKNN